MNTKYFPDKGNALAFLHKAKRDGYATALAYNPKDGLWSATIIYRTGA
jgi:hypothetical protein